MGLHNVHNACMGTKTISLKLAAYERLKAARRYPGESFSEVVMRAKWPEDAMTGDELLARCRKSGAFFSEAELNRIEEVTLEDRPPEDKWRNA